MLYTLVTEGSDDRVLLRPIEWLLRKHCRGSFSGQWANPRALDDASRDLTIRLAQVQRYFPADLYFVHRDRDNSTLAHRKNEISGALANNGCVTPAVCVIPVRMTEAWFLFNERAIRRAADRAHGRAALNLPTPQEAERRSDPKNILEEKLIVASELTGRRLSQFRAEMSQRKALVASNIDDFSPLRQHVAFCDMETSLKSVLAARGW